MFPTANQILWGVGTSLIVADKGGRVMLICDDVLLITMKNSSIFSIGLVNAKIV
jgi:hypothetical protein